MAIKRGLGRGLEALYDNTEAAEAEQKDLIELRISMIEPNRDQPRKDFDEDALVTLSNSIAEHGIIQPIIVSPPENGFYKIIAGERRWRAAKMAGLREIPAIVRTYEKQKAAEVAMLENLQREDLNPIEEAEGYKNLMENFGLTQENLSRSLGKSRSAIANSVRILSLPQNIIDMVRNGLISEGHARTLLSVEDDAEKQRLAEEIINEKLSVRDTEKIAGEKKTAKKIAEKKEISPEIKEMEKRLSDNFGSKVKIITGRKKGKIEIEYYGNDDFTRIMEKLGLKHN